mmetsp:Transcript_30007/g.87387  ORF Transcript_30007/g.87387 Transcript_30007/m.87387 type:complete len:108 (-) Transcript_30007:288-611(-)|eukprot:CAMPEP_0118974016 /NCGR_PEP_ID=MMETSP1173-20130426/11028_1 /TAXON_ID=1034831 /ORGANISM="Rhizochromulina marina cf, Strain CCMP1243" /LENGTH=107 /DNA_ID=CAMNT_0006923717 /DNA_START=201 /DNA_END=524 /DNA_ORIENTATION=+
MDYDGQRLAELLYYWIIIVFGAIGWIWGYLKGDFMLTFYAWAVGVGISVVLCVPDWPWFNRHPVRWSETAWDKRSGAEFGGSSGGGKNVKKKGGKKQQQQQSKEKSG